MAVLTIAELKALWINGFIPDQDDYVDLFDSVEALGGVAPSGGVAIGLGDFDPNGSEDPNDPSGETIIVPQEVTDFINDNPNKELLWLGSYTALDGYNFGLHILKYVVDDPNDPSQNFWEEVLTPTPQVFQVVRDVTTLPTSFQPANQYLYNAGVLNENQTGIYNGATEITLNLSESGDNLDPFGNVTIQRREIRNAGDGAINFVSQNSSPANVANVFVPNGKEPKISGKGVVVVTHTHDVASDTSTYVLSGDLDDTPSSSNAPTIQRATQTFRLNELNSTPITLVAAQGVDKAIFVDKVFISLKNYSGFNATSLFSELKIGQLMFNSPEILLEFGADQREHFVTQGAQTQIVRKNEVTNQPFTWTINPTDEAGFGAGSGTDVEFIVNTYYTVEDILDSNNLPN